MKLLTSSFVGVSGLFSALLLVLSPAPAEAAPWLAPAADERISADWVKDVAQAFRKNRFKNVFMNQPFGCDQCRIIHFLNNAAEALDNDRPKLAKSFIHRALAVLEDGKDEGWYTDADVRPIKRLIIEKANQGLKEAGAAQLALSPPRERGKDPRYERGDDPLFSRSDRSNQYGGGQERWSGYTEEHTYGLTERLDVDRDRQAQRDSRSARSRQSDEGRFDRYYSEDFSFEEQDAGQRAGRDRASHRRGMTRFPEEMTTEDALNALMEQDQQG
ncbi:hypothetical protein [Nitrospira moscoviensis]|uniref:Uncharacterized protein n=1 Tax=Nitrospira moscoviensis TaxID=42253 RepID=A0A0K2GDW7_NITMO|nr:hypothetical protein [Nitrospira moscoviensis]ALA59155.1 exported protein of unknown function [Nitrospira moscoviensis]